MNFYLLSLNYVTAIQVCYALLLSVILLRCEELVVSDWDCFYQEALDTVNLAVILCGKDNSSLHKTELNHCLFCLMDEQCNNQEALKFYYY